MPPKTSAGATNGSEHQVTNMATQGEIGLMLSDTWTLIIITKCTEYDMYSNLFISLILHFINRCIPCSVVKHPHVVRSFGGKHCYHIQTVAY